MAALAGMRCALGVASAAPSAASQQTRRVSRSPVDSHSGLARLARRSTSATGGSKRVPFMVAASSGPISPGDGLEAYNEQLRRAANADVWNSPSKSPAYTSADNAGSYSAPPQTPSVARDTQKEQVQDSLESKGEQAGQAASSAADAVQGGASRVGDQVRQEARYSDDALESAQRVGEAVQEQAANVGDEVGEQARRVARLGQEGVQEALDDPQAAAESAQQNLQGLVAEGAERADAVAQQAQSSGRKVQASAEEASERLQNATSRAFDRSSRAGEDVQSVMAEAAAESGAALEDVGQALRETGEDIAEEIVGKDTMDSFRRTAESLGLRGPDSSESSAESSMKGSMSSPRESQETGPEPERTTRIDGGDLVEVYKPAGSMVNIEKEGEEGGSGGKYKGLKVLVVGASGRTGRMVVENLVAKGVPVRAVATNVTRQRYLRQLQGVELVEADLTRYETLKRAIGDCNAIICAIGYRPSPLDPFGPYKVEYEGVANLVSAAKNNGNIDKFVFVTSIGVSNLLNPLNLFGGITFWKRQAELYLQRSGLTYTIVRPGGLKSETRKNASVVLKQADSQFMGAITRGQVAEVCVEALVLDKASDKIVEAVEQEMAPSRTLAELFELVA